MSSSRDGLLGSCDKNRSRVILLLDLDCFYAQCETVRLGLDPSTPLCLLQWNSALAVNYPAREKFQLKRGASFEEILKASAGECVALHLPVVSFAELQSSMSSTTSNNCTGTYQDHSECDVNNMGDELSSVEIAYDKEFNKSQEERRELFSREKNKMRHGGEGKASLDRYRLASARIFDVILEVLENILGKGNFTLEKASIDELYIDVTNHCYEFGLSAWTTSKDDQDRSSDPNQSSESLEELAKNETIICAKKILKFDSSTDEDIQALQRGCIIAHRCRKIVFDRLGFTLSAGISNNKLLAKLCCSYGKPNGQALAVPEAIPHILKDTKIKKARNLGGKIGKAVLELLPDDEDTMGSIARLLTVEHLSSILGSETGRMIWNYSQGIDDEPVKQTKGALTKSITSFKSFTVRSEEDLMKWISLLSADLFLRVNLDSNRNNRFPTVCTIQYYVRDINGTRNRNGKSVRLPFPSIINKSDVNATFAKKVEHLLRLHCRNLTHIVRLGLCAVNFKDRAKESIVSLIRCHQKSAQDVGEKRSTDSKNNGNLKSDNLDGAISKIYDKDNFRVTKSQGIKNGTGSNSKSSNQDDHPSSEVDDAKCVDPDLAYAQKLQAMYDRENQILSQNDGRINRSKGNTQHRKKARIEHFFKPKK